MSTSEAGAADQTDAALRIVVGENNSDLALTLSMLLDSEPDMRCVATAATGRAVLAAIEQYAPNAFILDLSLDDGSSLPLIADVRSRVQHAGIVVFTGHKNDWLNDECRRAGADAVVVKTSEFEVLTAALRQAASRQRAGAALDSNRSEP